MKSKLLIVLLILIAAVMAAGCSQAATEPDITGVVNAVEGDRILVVEGLERAGVPQEEWFGKRAIFFTLTGDTVIERDGEPVTPDNFTGLKVAVWADGAIAESYPEQAKAARVVILEDLGGDSGETENDEAESIETEKGEAGTGNAENGAAENGAPDNSELMIDSGSYAGIDGDTFFVKISGVPEEVGTKEFHLSAELRDNFEQYALAVDDPIKFTYTINENGEAVIIAISKIDNQ